MPTAIQEVIRRRVIEQWLSGESRDKIASDLQIGAGTVSGIVSEFKIGLDAVEFDSARELALHAKKQDLNLSDLASNFRLHNFIKTSGNSEDQIESFITNISSSELPQGKLIELINQLYDLSKEQSIPLQEVPGYIGKKLVEKQKIDEQIQEADTLLQNKNVGIQTINEHLQLNGKLNEHRLSFQDNEKLLKILVNAARYGFDGKKIASTLYDIQDLERKERGLKNKCEELSKQAAKYKDILRLTEEIAALQRGK